MSVARPTGNDVTALGDLRSTRRALRGERVRVARWRRLVRARLELAVASATLPGPLGEEATDVLPVLAENDLPTHIELAVALRSGLPDGEVDLIEPLRDLDRRLARYAETVEEALARTTEELICRLATDPAATLRVYDAAPDPR